MMESLKEIQRQREAQDAVIASVTDDLNRTLERRNAEFSASKNAIENLNSKLESALAESCFEREKRRDVEVELDRANQSLKELIKRLSIFENDQECVRKKNVCEIESLSRMITKEKEESTKNITEMSKKIHAHESQLLRQSILASDTLINIEDKIHAFVGKCFTEHRKILTKSNENTSVPSSLVSGGKNMGK